MRRRTHARAIALQILYELDQRGEETTSELDQLLEERARDPEIRDYARELVVGVREYRPAIDALIAQAAHNWELDRMAIVDRNILRLGVFELLHRPDVPPVVAINEAIELAKRYSTRASGAFVNGILDTVRARHRPDDPQPSGEAQRGP